MKVYLHKQDVTLGTVDWSNVDSIYNWIKKLKRPNESQKPKLVTSFGAEFPLQGRGETLKQLIIGEGVKDGICKRFKSNKAKMHDKGRHPIPILANGPGTGKSRFLQELPTLLEHLDEYQDFFDEKDLEDLCIFNNLKMLSINITFNTKTGTLSELEASAGPASVALRILYEYFISVIKDNNSTIDLVIIGIDELNRLHSLSKGDQKPVHDIVYAVGDLSCSERSILYVPILAGTIQGPLEHIITESTYKLLRLPLRLLSNEEMAKISTYMGNRERLLKEYVNQHNKTFQRCLSDLGGQVRAMEFFYDFLLKEINLNHTVDYVYVLERVKFELTEGYPFRDVVTCMKHVVACAILNIPVDKDYEIENGVSYVDLSSKGIISLEELPYPNPRMLFYVRMPYMWVWILTSIKGFEAGKFWDVMISQDTHILRQAFEDFNVRFWVLRLQLLKVLYRKIKIQDLLRGAHHAVSCPLLDYEFQLPTVEEYYVELKSRFPENVKIEHLSPGTMYKNGKGAPCADHFFFLGNLLVFIQVKSSDATTEQPQSLSKGMIKNEYEKAEIGYEQFKSSFKGECPIKHWVLFICTNGSSTKGCFESLPENCFVVDCGNFKAFYGYTFSTRAEFSAANDKLDANTAEEYELRTIRGIGPGIASEIDHKRKERPFEDENDLYIRVKRIPPEAKTKIKVVKKYC